MGKLIIAFLLLSLSVAADFQPPKYTINLDLPPRERFVEVFKAFESPIKTLSDGVMSNIGTLEYYFMASLLRLRYLESEREEELAGACEAIDFSYNTAILLNYLYELQASCTSIVLRQKNGNLLHGRNLDYNFTKYFYPLTVTLDFVKDGKLLYTTTNMAGSLGIITGMKEGAFSVSIDQRDSPNNEGSFWDNIWSTVWGYKGNLFLLRDAFEKFDNYEEAKNYIVETQVIAPAYYIICGLTGNDGTVVTHDRGKTADVWQLSAGDWFLVQTNYDHWMPPPDHDNRRVIAQRLIYDTQQKSFNSEKLWDVLSNPYVMVENWTVYTVVMEPATGYYKDMVRKPGNSPATISELEAIAPMVSQRVVYD